MGFIFSIGVIWVTYQVLTFIEVVERKQKTRVIVRSNSDRKAA